MKKIIIFLITALIFVLSACSNAGESDDKNTETEENTSISTEEKTITDIENTKATDIIDNESINETVNKFDSNEIRIIYLPPMTVAAYYATGNDCESKAMNMITQFINESGLLEIKPDARNFGFDCSGGAGIVGENSSAYEVWVSVPSDMEIPAPFIKREFNGGLYAAHVLRAWDFNDWNLLSDWVNVSDKYDSDWGSPRWKSPETVFGQGFEETLNYYNYIQKDSDFQLDLLFPIKER